MHDQTDPRKLLIKFGLDLDEANIYLHLLKNGSQTALQLSRDLNISRTSVYRAIEELTHKSLVSEVIQEKGREFEVNSNQSFKHLIDDQKEEIDSLESSIPAILESLSLLTQKNVAKSKIKYYSGIDGLKQITWNETKAKEVFRIYEIGKMGDFLDGDFNSEVLQEFVNNKIQDLQMTNKKVHEEFTNVTEFVEECWNVRHIAKSDLEIGFETIIYNNIYGMYQYRNGEIFGVEIYNEDLAETEKQLFDFIWSYAIPMKKLNSKGHAILE